MLMAGEIMKLWQFLGLVSCYCGDSCFALGVEDSTRSVNHRHRFGVWPINLDWNRRLHIKKNSPEMWLLATLRVCLSSRGVCRYILYKGSIVSPLVWREAPSLSAQQGLQISSRSPFIIFNPRECTDPTKQSSLERVVRRGYRDCGLSCCGNFPICFANRISCPTLEIGSPLCGNEIGTLERSNALKYTGETVWTYEHRRILPKRWVLWAGGSWRLPPPRAPG